MPKKAIALLRVSSEAQAGADRQGLPAQRRAVQQIASAHDLQLIDEVEIHLSGAKVLEDSRFRALLDRIAASDIQGVVCADLDRLMRPEDPGYYSIFSRFKETETVLYTSAGAKDFRSDRLLMILEAEIAAMERQRIAERTRRGREMKRRQGMRAEGPVGMPRGVDFDHETGQWEYVFPEAERVRRCFELFLASHGTLSFAEIGRRTGLTQLGSKDKRAVGRVLGHPIYKGVYRVDRRWIDGKPVPRAPEDVIEMQVLEPLVPPDEWERVQELVRVKRTRRAPRRTHDAQEAVYAGHLECAVCGASMWVVRDSRGYGAYCCGNARDEKCPTGQTSVRIAEPQIDQALEARLGDQATLRRLIEKAADEAARRAESSPGEIQAEINRLHNQRERLIDGYQEGTFELPELRKRMARLNDDLGLLQRQLERAPRPIRIDESLISDLVLVFGSWTDLSTTEKRELLEAYQIRVALSRPARRKLSVDHVLIGVADSPDGVRISKKLIRYGMQ